MKTAQREGLERREDISGQGAAWGRVQRNQWAEPEVEAEGRRQVTVKRRLEKVMERARREHSESQGGPGGETLNKKCVRGLWSVNKVKFLPSRRNQKCLTV